VASSAFSIVLLKRFFDSIPSELPAAASIDGAGPLRALWSAVLPMYIGLFQLSVGLPENTASGGAAPVR
jgi:ABC-type glycerol-3-phosphate transport system permease component